MRHTMTTEKPVEDFLLQDSGPGLPNPITSWRQCLCQLDGEWTRSESRFHNDHSLVFYGAGPNIDLPELLSVASPSAEELFEERHHAPKCFW